MNSAFGSSPACLGSVSGRGTRSDKKSIIPGKGPPKIKVLDSGRVHPSGPAAPFCPSSGDEVVDYAFMGTDPNSADNRWLFVTMEGGLPQAEAALIAGIEASSPYNDGYQ
jgi:hypothetical protein